MNGGSFWELVGKAGSDAVAVKWIGQLKGDKAKIFCALVGTDGGDAVADGLLIWL